MIEPLRLRQALPQSGTAFVADLRLLSPDKRVQALTELREQAGFCFECGFVESEPHTCQCWNDE